MRLAVLLCGTLLAACASRPPVTERAVRPERTGIEATLLLIGDAGAPGPAEPALTALAREIAIDGSRTTVLFLGDNIYPRGMPDSADPARPEAERRLAAQLDAAAGAAQVLLIPGNHDWDYHGEDGWEAVRRQQRFVAEKSRARLLPGGGCPGPEILELGTQLRLVLLDTQWWLHEGPRPGPESECPTRTPAEVVGALDAAIASAGGRQVIVAGHHPLQSSGPHAGRFGWTDHVFPLRALAGWAWLPLPVIGSAYPIARQSGVSRQDQSSSANAALRAALQQAFAGNPPLAYAAGHEHGLEVHRGASARYLLVSGAGSAGKLSPLHARAGSLFSASAPGLMRIDGYRDGRVRLTVMTVGADGIASDAWSEWIH